MGEPACWVHELCPACGRVGGGSDAPQPLILLVGLMGVGKTTVGQEVASRLGWTFVDNDELFERRTGTTAAAYAAEHGDAAMHEVEWDLLREAVERLEPTVLAVPGSVVEAPALDLGHAFVVWLQVEPAVVADRLEVGDHRPLLGDQPAAVLERLLAERAERYRELADLAVDATGRSPSELAGRIVDTWCHHAGHF